MNWSKAIISLAIFYGLIAIIFAGIGETLKTNADVAYVATGVDLDDYTIDVESYQHLVDRSAKKIGLDQFKMGEYNFMDGDKDAITVHAVWHSTRKMDSFKSEEFAEKWYLQIPLVGGWLRDKNIRDAVDRYKREHMSRIGEGEQVYLYPYFEVDLRKASGEYLGLWKYIVVRGWDVVGNEWFTNMWRWSPAIGDTKLIVARLDGGVMPQRDLYYCIDFVVCDTDITDYFTLERYLQIGKADVAERYGGVIYGDVSIQQPQYMQPHQLSMKPTGGVSGFFEIIGNVGIAYNAFQGYGVVSLLINAFLFIPIGIGMTYIVFDVARSFVPFIRGG